jgi:ElaB/YqjD/DUF883 family membrane-anchored ribosome-binding protein
VETFNDPTSPTNPGDGTSQMKSKASALGHKAADAVDARRDSVARGIETAAMSLHEHAETLPGGEKVARAARAAANTMEAAAEYVRDQDVQAMLSDVRQMVRRHPGATLLTVAAVGFLLARSLTRH